MLTPLRWRRQNLELEEDSQITEGVGSTVINKFNDSEDESKDEGDKVSDNICV
jgi:hypothetical protein